MDAITKVPKKHLYAIIGFSGLAIFAASLETMFLVKDLDLYNAWLRELGQDIDNAFDLYVTLLLGQYFTRIIIPVAFSLYSYFAYVKIRINKLFIFMWFVLIVGALAYNILGMTFQSVFFYIYLVSYLALLFTILSLNYIIDENKQNER